MLTSGVTERVPGLGCGLLTCVKKNRNLLFLNYQIKLIIFLLIKSIHHRLTANEFKWIYKAVIEDKGRLHSQRLMALFTQLDRQWQSAC